MKRKYIWKSREVTATDDAELRVLAQMVRAADTMLALSMIGPEEHQQTLAEVDLRLRELEDKYGLDNAD